jgi:carbamate kinase
MTNQNKRKLALVAIGGNSLIKDKEHQSVADQYEAMKETSHHIGAIIKDGWDVAVTHGNGPQVGFILRRSELAAHELHEVPLDACVADTQGSLGYALQQNLYNEFQSLGLDKEVVTLVTQVEVAADDPAFAEPSKPVGGFMDKTTAVARQQNRGWDIAEDAGRGWRRVVASPQPRRIVEAALIKQLLANGTIVISAGGGGIPVVRDERGFLHGVPAVIDKDIASALLATAVNADLLLISTSIEKVMLHFKQPNERALDHMTLAEAKQYMAEGIHFAKGSMGPKMEAVINFLENGGQKAIITTPENIPAALRGEAGTTIKV